MRHSLVANRVVSDDLQNENVVTEGIARVAIRHQNQSGVQI